MTWYIMVFSICRNENFKDFGRTDSNKFSRPFICTSIQTSEYGYENIQKFPINLYKERLKEFLNNN